MGIGSKFCKRHRALLLAALATCGSAALVAAESPDSAEVTKFLGQSIDWYRAVDTQSHIADQPADLLFVYDDRQLATSALSFAFSYGRAEAQLLQSQNPAAGGNAAEANETQTENISRLLAQAEDSVRHELSQIEVLQKRLADASGHERTVVESQLSEEQSELALAESRRDTLQNMLGFRAGTSGAKLRGDLLSQVSALEQSVPEARSAATPAANGGPSGPSGAEAAPAPSAPVSIPATKPAPAGILGLSQSLLSLRTKISTLREAIGGTDALILSARALMSPLAATLAAGARQGNQLASQPTSPDPKVNAQRKAQIDAIDTDFKRNSTAFLPLAKMMVLLNLYKANLESWQSTVASQQKEQFKSLAIRLGMLGLALLIAAGISVLWRRVTFHYVSDSRRRNQFLLLRRIVMFCVFAVIVAISLSTDVSSFTTFAGLLAAGLAVSLQSVILSALGYFVLLGKYRVHIGDRLEVAGVIGNVVDVDLMRISLMEVGKPGSGADNVPTGRTVEFPNSVVFQTAFGFFKQIPGTSFLWHEIVITLASGDHRDVEQRVLNAVDQVFRDYRDKVQLQHDRMERALNLHVETPQPSSRLRFTRTGLEMTVRYPVTRESAAEIDDRITRALLEVMEVEPKLKSVAPASTDVQAREAASAASASSEQNK